MQLQSRLVFEGFPSGSDNYSYLRELRNAVVHRGLDITSDAQFDDTSPMIFAKPKIKDRFGKNTFVAFDRILESDKCMAWIKKTYGLDLLDFCFSEEINNLPDVMAAKNNPGFATEFKITAA